MIKGTARLGALLVALATAASAGSFVKDGDGLIIDGQDYRFVTADAFEPYQTCLGADGVTYSCGERAKDALSELIEGKSVECKSVGKAGDRFLATCSADNTDLETEMVRAGWAFPRRDFKPHDPDRFAELCAVEKQARDAKHGAWAGSFELPYVQKRGTKELSKIACTEIASRAAEEPSSTAEKVWLGTEAVAALLGGLAGALFTLGLQAFWNWWHRPILTLNFDDAVPGCRVETPAIARDRTTVQQVHLRLRIRNRGRTFARNVSVNITEIGFDSATTGEQAFDEEVLEPRMALTADRAIFNLASEGHRFVDIAHAVQASFGPAALALDLGITPVRLQLLGFQAGDYRMRVFVAAENADSIPQEVRFAWNGTLQGLTITR
jgi:endonuclease YncB( thermonuclease family)